jgi:hypothetical protein
MIWFALAAVAAVASSHSITGAFGFRLGEMPGSKITACEKNEYPDKTRMFACAGDNFFRKVYVHTELNRITILSGSRVYKDPDSEKAADACRGDLQPLKEMIEAKYPGLLRAVSHRKLGGFKFTEELYMGQLPVGRSIEGYCDEMNLPTTGTTYDILWLTYTLSDKEESQLDDLNDAEKLKSKGLDPNQL